MPKAIPIINPIDGGIKYTKSADRFIAMGLAELHPTGLYFFEHKRDTTIYNDMSYWNGSRGSNHMYLPGQVRS
jgi:hypothetical protein